jgi:hypothetical protein
MVYTALFCGNVAVLKETTRARFTRVKFRDDYALTCIRKKRCSRAQFTMLSVLKYATSVHGEL